MKINLVNYEQPFNNGILTKYSERISENLTLLGIENTITPLPVQDCDINHHINYLQYHRHIDRCNRTKNTLMVTHITTDAKFEAVQAAMQTADVGICMSYSTMFELMQKGINGYQEGRLRVVNGGHDCNDVPIKKIGIVTNIYPDGCKQQELYYQLFDFINKMNLNRFFYFYIMGSGWDQGKFIKETTYIAEFNHFWYKDFMDNIKYGMYLSNDEGSKFIEDCVHNDIRVIFQSQGFHKEINNLYKCCYPFKDFKQLTDIFTEFCICPIHKWSWMNYTLELLKIWEVLNLKK